MPMFAALLFAMLVAPAPDALPNFPPALEQPEVATKRVKACGFTSVRSVFDPTLQEDVIEVRDVASATPGQLACAAAASLASSYYLTFPEAIQQAYQIVYYGMSHERDVEHARAWLQARGLLARLPSYDPERSDDLAFARSLEALCGPKAEGTFRLIGPGMVTFRPGVLGTVAKDGFTEGRLDEETLWCLTNAATASGFFLGFVGNEAYSAQP
jgi:hypothetical protein